MCNPFLEALNRPHLERSAYAVFPDRIRFETCRQRRFDHQALDANGFQSKSEQTAQS